MKRAGFFFGFVGQVALLVVLALVVIVVVIRLSPLQPLAGQPAGSPADSPSPDPGYPPPGGQPVEPTPDSGYPPPGGQPVEPTTDPGYPPPGGQLFEPTLAPSETPTTVKAYTTITPVPITPYPTLTLNPGPSPTLISIKEPAKDARGIIFFVAKEAQAASSAIYSMGMDETGKKTGTVRKLSENEFPEGDIVFPSSDGKYMAIVGAWGIFSIVNTETGMLEKAALTSISDGIFFNWFPDNHRILYGDGMGPLVLRDPFSGEYSLLAVPGYGNTWAAAASPDGQYVVYRYNTDVIYPKGLWIINTNGQDAHLLVKDINPQFLSWSPDGKQIAFYEYGWQIVNADGSNLREVAPGVVIPHCHSNPPLWSPDSRSLAVVTSQSGEGLCQEWSNDIFIDTNIVLIDVDSGKARPLLANGSTGNIDPAWSPDGSQIVFVSNRGGAPAVWAVNVDGENLRQLTEDYAMVRFPMWRRSSE